MVSVRDTIAFIENYLNYFFQGDGLNRFPPEGDPRKVCDVAVLTKRENVVPRTFFSISSRAS
jgi:hypothetical protein